MIDPTTGEEVHCSKVRVLRKVLTDLKFTFKQFVDLCILCGCDYNTNIKRVGPKTSYKLIRNHKDIDNLPDKYDKSCLVYQRCRQLFSIKSVHQLTDNFDLSVNPRACADNFEQIKSLQLEEYVKGMTKSLETLNKTLIIDRTTRSPFLLKINFIKSPVKDETDSSLDDNPLTNGESKSGVSTG